MLHRKSIMVLKAVLDVLPFTTRWHYHISLVREGEKGQMISNYNETMLNSRFKSWLIKPFFSHYFGITWINELHEIEISHTSTLGKIAKCENSLRGSWAAWELVDDIFNKDFVGFKEIGNCKQLFCTPFLTVQSLSSSCAEVKHFRCRQSSFY